MNEMITKVEKTLTHIMKNESGQGALIAVLILLVLGSLVVPPLLGLMSTGLKAGQAHESRLGEFYAADAGVEDALYKIKHEELPDWMKGDWGEATYSHDPYVYGLGEVNSKEVEVAIQPIWVLEGLENPKAEQGTEPHNSLVTVGDVIGESPDGTKGYYQIGIIYDGSLGALKIERIGCWLPLGFQYVPGSSNLEEDPGQEYYCIPTTSNFRGGTTVTWDYGTPGINYEKLPSSGGKRLVTFYFTPKVKPQGSFSWIRTNRIDIHLSWDLDCKLYRITSNAASPSAKYTTIEAYTVKEEFHKLGSPVEGDYHAIGNTLMRDHDGEGCGGCRERLYAATSASITENDIPSDATVEKVYLYWSGWKNEPWDVWGMSEEDRQNLPSNNEVNEVALTIDLDKVQIGDFTYYGPHEVSTTVTADTSSVLPNGSPSYPHGWTYSCSCDITNHVKDLYRDLYGNPGDEVSFNGQGGYTVGHAYLDDTGVDLYEWKDNHSGETIVAKTGYPLGSTEGINYYNSWCYSNCSQDEWSYAAWSMVIIYSSPVTKGHMLYIDDTFRYADNGETQTFDITGFLAPQQILEEENAARMTCFVAEGDECYGGGGIYDSYCLGHYGCHDWDCIKLNDEYLSDDVNPWNNVWNSKSNLVEDISIDGIDIDTFSVGYPTIKPGDVEANVELPTGVDSWNLIYIVLSFRSEITTGGTITYEYGVN